MTNAGYDMAKHDLLYTVGRNANSYNHYENSMEIPQKSTDRTIAPGPLPPKT
jgi:hypothetical protein